MEGIAKLLESSIMMDDMTEKERFKFDFYKEYAELSLKYGIGKGMTLGEFYENKECQQKDKLVAIKALFNIYIPQILNDPKNKKGNPQMIERLINKIIRQNDVFALDEDKEIKDYFKQRVIELLDKLKESIDIERESSQTYKTLNYTEFIYLCIELGLVSSKEPDRKLQADQIREIYEKYEHPIFNKIKLRNHINDKTDILSQVKKYMSDDKNNTTVKKVQTIINELKLNSD